MISEAVQEVMNPILDQLAKDVFTLEHRMNTPTEELRLDVFGILLAKYTEWDGVAILRIAASGLEDANFHSEAGTLTEMIDKIEEEFS